MDDYLDDDGTRPAQTVTLYGVWITKRSDGEGGRWLLRDDTVTPWTGPEAEAERLAEARNALHGQLRYEVCEYSDG
jgi:hypothetical protein